MTKETFLKSAKKCCENGRRLLDEAEILEFEKTLATRYYLSMIAQEEAAKAFVLYLVSVGALPWTPFILRATRDHQCKQLVGIILDYISPDTDEFLKRMDMWRLGKRQLPARVADAMNLLRHEKIQRWESNLWFWDKDPDYDKEALRVAEGKLDKIKQCALYVEIGRNGQVGTTPALVKKSHANKEYKRGRRFVTCVDDLVNGRPGFALDIERVRKYFRILFSQTNAFIEWQAT